MMLRELYVVDLNQLRDGLRQMLLEWPVLSARAESNAVRTALDEHYTDTRAQLDRIETLLSDLDERPRSPEVDSVAPLVRLARLRYAELGSSEVRDLALVTSSSLVDCHLLGLYGAACAGARAVGHPEAVRTLTGLIAEQQGWLERLACLRVARGFEPEINVMHEHAAGKRRLGQCRPPGCACQPCGPADHRPARHHS